MQKNGEPPPTPGSRVLCRHPFLESKRAYVNPARVEPLLQVYWNEGACPRTMPSLEHLRLRVQTELRTIRQDHKRNLNPTPYKVSVSDSLYAYLHKLWLQNAPIGELS
jgi:nicotinate phosphoribosyltransferase